MSSSTSAFQHRLLSSANKLNSNLEFEDYDIYQDDIDTLATILKDNTNYNIKSLSLNCCRFDLDFDNNVDFQYMVLLMDALHQNSTIVNLNLIGCGIDLKCSKLLANVLKNNGLRQLETLNLAGNSLGDNGIISIANAIIESLLLIQTLKIQRNDITAIGAQSLFNACALSQIRHLDIRFNNIGIQGIQYLVYSIQNNNSKYPLQVLRISGIECGDEGIKILVHAMIENQENVSLQELDVSNNNISKSGAAEIANLLLYYPSLKVLNCSNNEIGKTWYNIFSTSGIIYFSEALIHNISLIELDVGQITNISNGDIEALANMLSKNNSLQKLHLNHTNITSTGAIMLANVLTQNKTLLILDLQFNNIDDRGGIALANALKQNPTLEALNINCNKISDAGAIVF
jgi:Ran GTPase-activating protein (RanGAP) involved in mRNA processing and transport